MTLLKLLLSVWTYGSDSFVANDWNETCRLTLCNRSIFVSIFMHFRYDSAHCQTLFYDVLCCFTISWMFVDTLRTGICLRHLDKILKKYILIHITLNKSSYCWKCNAFFFCFDALRYGQVKNAAPLLPDPAHPPLFWPIFSHRNTKLQATTNKQTNQPTNKQNKINWSWSCVIPNSLKDLGKLLAICPGTFLELDEPSAPEPSGPHQFSAPEPSGTLSAIGPKPSRIRRNLISYLPGNGPEPHQPSPPEPSGTSSAAPEPHSLSAPEPQPHQPSAPEPLEPHQPFAPGNLISHLHRNPPKPHRPSAPEPSRTLRNLLRNLALQLRQVAPELFWAKDPIASLLLGKKNKLWWYPQQQ